VKENSLPLYREIYDDIKRGIENGEFNPGDKIPTELEIANKYSVSRITAVRAVKELEQSGFISRARKRGSTVNLPGLYSSNNNQIPFISMILPYEMKNCLAIVDGAQSKAILGNFALSVYDSSMNEKIERNIIESLLEMDAAGYIVLPVAPYGNLEIFSKLVIGKKPLVFLDFPKIGIDAPCISADNKTAMFELTSYLIEKGHTNIAFYSTSIKNVPTESERYSGYIDALVKNGILPKRGYLLEIHKTEDAEILRNGDEDAIFSFNGQKARQSLDYLMTLETPPTAIMCVNDICASHVMREALKMNIEVPEALSITGFDNLDICSYMQVPISTMQQDFNYMGQKAVDLIMRMRNGNGENKNYLIDTELIKRQSVADIN
jgi:GntR family transcriptional regulator of arabinose operon